MNRQGWLVFCVCLATVSFGSLAAEPADSDKKTDNSAECGVYSMYAAAKSIGYEIDSKSFFCGKYVSTASGSSVKDLVDLAAAHQIYAEPLQNISISYLKNSNQPILLNFKMDKSDPCPGHWVTFLGVEEGKAIVFDNLHQANVRQIGFGQLSILMSGHGIRVSHEKPSFSDDLILNLGPYFCLWPCFVIFFASLILPRNLNRTLVSFGLIPELAIVFLLAISCGLCQWFLGDDGFGQNRSAVAWLESKHVENSFPTVSFEQLQRVRIDSDVVLVDARPENLFEYGHIPNAVNISVALSPDEFEEQMQRLPREKTAIVYCASEVCEWDEVVARRLHAFGHNKIRIYQEGIAKFVEKVREHQSAN
jgi:rhodanese-related sulfurtransferase